MDPRLMGPVADRRGRRAWAATARVGGLLAGLLLGLGLTGCGELDPAVGVDRDDVAAVCAAGDSDPSTDVSWVEVRDTVFRGFCGCHTSPGGLGQTVGGLNLEELDAALAGGFRSQGVAIVPGDPCGSVVVQKTGPTPPFGARMPLNSVSLQPDLRQKIIDWIAEGAQR